MDQWVWEVKTTTIKHCQSSALCRKNKSFVCFSTMHTSVCKMLCWCRLETNELETTTKSVNTLKSYIFKLL
jgi:hypothetical protein